MNTPPPPNKTIFGIPGIYEDGCSVDVCCVVVIAAGLMIVVWGS